MDLNENVGGRDRLARAALAVVLTVAAVRSLRNGKRLRGLLAGIGALVFGFNATSGYCSVNDVLDRDTTGGESDEDEEEETVVSISESDGDDESSDGASSAGSKKAERGWTLTCAACGNDIVTGEARGPNESGDIVHETCN
ncbi:YgaP family membrane protein [Haloarcula nitratireducens]|uniref:DUF2892 domain-containing protein n=1 Tax=Haloarcula nitratireducens TaxID=2487749 RepID=A0AAW4PA58_9EURY|nr:DUF2892 domain-containing protein [Halomicroarcula nitratireducens]MBX0294794.1 DUF2892 domain-containing protein [Halomicroarcula nitratireducens]